MDDKTRNFLVEHEYKAVSTDNIKSILKHGCVKGLHIEITSSNPSMLLARVKENDVIVDYNRMNEYSPEYLQIKQQEKFKTMLFIVPVIKIN